ncbi:hypothetical protein [Pseudonocardia sp. GCM10023141]|uniref:hypothetical protein n=1 Tax=Pseudonocardia sp. GCM10023141 TaxID=3252653 RepID=UPI00360AB6E6
MSPADAGLVVALRRRHTYDPTRSVVRARLFGIATNLVLQHRDEEIRLLKLSARASGATRLAVAGHDDAVVSAIDAGSVTRYWAGRRDSVMPEESNTAPALDRALHNLHAGGSIDERVLSAARERLMAAAAAEFADPAEQAAVVALPRRSHRRRWGRRRSGGRRGRHRIATGPDGSAPGDEAPASAAAEGLYTVASKITTSDPALQPGQFRYTARYTTQLMERPGRSGRTYTWTVESLLEVWTPADYQQEWLSRRSTAGEPRWIEGTAAEAAADGIDVDLRGPGGEMRARCGDFTATLERPARRPCVGSSGWQGVLTPEFLAGLPRNGQDLHDVLDRDIDRRGSDPDTAILVWTTRAVGSPLMTADLRAALYRALGHIDGIAITDAHATLDGQTGTAYGLTRGSNRMEIVIDPSTGRFSGSREWSNGTLLASTSSTQAVVGAQGAAPGH